VSAPASVPPGSLAHDARLRRSPPSGGASAGAWGVPDAAERQRLRASVGAALRHERDRADLTQDQLAQLAGCHPSAVQRVETGWFRPTDALLAALAWALTNPAGWSPQRARAAELTAELEAAAGGSLILASPRRARWRRNRLRDAQRAARRGTQ
jgi:transcriptional regulator with XRE-family HTH domain